MRLLALSGSLALFVYIVVVLAFTFVNVSKWFFGLDPEEYDFLARQGTIMLWPLVIISEEGRAALKAIWNGDLT